MQQVKHHRGRMSRQGKNFLMSTEETDPNVIREMFMKRFGRLITDKIILKYSKATHKDKEYVNTFSLKQVNFNAEKRKRLTPGSIYISGEMVRLTVEDIIYEVPVSLFSADFIISLKKKVASNLKEQLISLNGEV